MEDRKVYINQHIEDILSVLCPDETKRTDAMLAKAISLSGAEVWYGYHTSLGVTSSFAKMVRGALAYCRATLAGAGDILAPHVSLSGVVHIQARPSVLTTDRRWCRLFEDIPLEENRCFTALELAEVYLAVAAEHREGVLSLPE